MSTTKTKNESTEHEHVHGPDCDHDHDPSHAGPYKREIPKIGRNDPCYCGSGKKFKKCHGSVAAD